MKIFDKLHTYVPNDIHKNFNYENNNREVEWKMFMGKY